jgi:D-aminopeptidase
VIKQPIRQVIKEPVKRVIGRLAKVTKLPQETWETLREAQAQEVQRRQPEQQDLPRLKPPLQHPRKVLQIRERAREMELKDREIKDTQGGIRNG